MSAYLSEFSSLLLRWLHVVAAIAWIGESIYFVMLDNSLRPPQRQQEADQGVHGEMFAVHGGGFYHNRKFLTRAPQIGPELHWSFWKAYTTWLSGFALFAVIYLASPQLYLINAQSPWEWARSLSGMQAGTLAVGYLIVGWLAYDQLCRRISPNMQRDGILSLAVAVLMIVIAWSTSQIFPGRAAFLITAAVMATAMSANVFFWIIPGQRRMVRALTSGTQPDPLDGSRGKQRSVHNTYFTLPVVLLMLSNHYAFLYRAPYNWLVMSLFILSGALIRQYFVQRHSKTQHWGYIVFGVALIVVAAWFARPGQDQASTTATDTASASQETADLAQVKAVIGQRCIQCHAARPSMDGFSSPPAGIELETSGQLTQQADTIKRVVADNTMPLGNVTGMTASERDIIAAWQP